MSGQPEKNIRDVFEVLKGVEYEGHDFVVGPMEDGFYVQIAYKEADVESDSDEPVEQRGRKWYVSRFATDSEIVQTCLVAALWSAEHRVREHFMYCPETANEPRAIYGPHFDANALWLMAGDPKATDARIPPEPPRPMAVGD